MHSRTRMRITGMSLCRYIKETRRPRMRVASRLKHQRALAYRPRGMTGPCVRVGIQWAQLTRYLIAPRRRQRRRRGPNVKVVLCLIYATEPRHRPARHGAARQDKNWTAGRESTATAPLGVPPPRATLRRAKTLNPDDDRVERGTRMRARAVGLSLLGTNVQAHNVRANALCYWF